MTTRLEITLKSELKDPEGENLRKKARNYLGLTLEEVRTLQVLTFDTSLTDEQLEDVRGRIFTNPVTQVSSFKPLAGDFDWLIWVGFLPGVRDNAGSTASNPSQGSNSGGETTCSISGWQRTTRASAS